MTPSTLRTLRELAKAASACRWKPMAESVGYSVRTVTAGIGEPIAKKVGRYADAQHIAACDPQTILALLDRIEALEEIASAVRWFRGELAAGNGVSAGPLYRALDRLDALEVKP